MLGRVRIVRLAIVLEPAADRREREPAPQSQASQASAVVTSIAIRPVPRAAAGGAPPGNGTT